MQTNMKDLAPIWRGSVNNGELKLVHSDLFKRYLHSLRGEVELVVRKWRKKRTDKQNRYYWGVVIPILCESFGYSNEEMHEALKWKFLKNRKSDKLVTVKSTAGLSTIGFNNYVDGIVRWSAQEGIVIPDPDQIDI